MWKKILIFLLPIFIYGENLDQLVQLSIENKLVEATKYNNQALKKNYESVQNSYKPSVTIGSTFSDAKYETAMNANSSLTSFTSVNYTIYDGGIKKERYSSLEKNIKQANQNLDSLKNKISLNIVELYFNYLSAVSIKDAYLKEIKTLKAQKNRLDKFFQAGITTKDEIEKIESRVENVNVLLHEQNLNLETILHNLEYLTSKKVSIVDGSKIDKITIEKTPRADIEAMKFHVESLKHQALITKAKNNPQVTLDNTYYSYDNNFDNQTYDTLDEQNIFKVNVAWKVFDFDTTNKSYQADMKKYLSAKSNYEYEKQKANIDFKLAQKAIAISKKKIISAKFALKASSSTFEIIEQKYKNGLVDNIAYLDALSNKYSAMANLDVAKHDLEIKKAHMIYHGGKNVWEYIK